MKTDAFKSYATLLCKLHEYIRNDTDDSPEADTLRDQMDSYWNELSSVERDEAGRLSEDLYSIGQPREVIPSDSPKRRQAANVLLPMHGRNAHEEIIAYLHEHSDCQSSEEVQYIRSREWFKLGLMPVALAFMRDACRLAPQKDEFHFILIDMIVRMGMWDEAMEAVKAYRDAPEGAPAILLHKAADVLMARAEKEETKEHRDAHLSEAEKLYRLALRKGLKKPLYRAVAESLLAACLHRQGKMDEVLGHFAKAIELQPNYHGFYVARGVFLYSRDPQRSADDFRRAVELSTPLPQAYLGLGLRLVENKDYARALSLLRVGVGYAPQGSPLAACFHMLLGICIAETSGKQEEAMKHMATASQWGAPARAVAHNIRAIENLQHSRQDVYDVKSSQIDALLDVPPTALMPAFAAA